MTKDTEDDNDLFRKAMHHVRPLVAQDKINRKTMPQQGNSAYRQYLAQLIPAPRITNISLPQVTAEQKLSYAKTGLNSKQFERFKQGKIKVDAVLDLHAYTIKESLEALQDFFLRAQQLGYRCLNIIHGKGQHKQAYLKSTVLAFLTTQTNIIAYHSAPPYLGGTGAVLVLLSQ